jgi:hypothetical protein
MVVLAGPHRVPHLRQDGCMSGGDLLGAAVAELYSADPDEFNERRTQLTGQARAAGQPLAARQIAALRKPTRSAWVINQLARSDPDSASKLAALGERLRAAERSGDGVRMRELTQQRRQLIGALVRQALAVAGQSAAPAAMREEITATFAAALADPEVAGQIQQGTLVRAASRPGFGSGQAPLVLVPPLPDAPKEAKGKAGAAPGRSRSAAPAAPAASPSPRQQSDGERRVAASPRQATQERQNRLALAAQRREAKLAEAAARAQAQAQERQAKLRAAAEQAVADADQAAAAAVQDEREQAQTVRRLEHELTDARYRLRMASAEVRRAEAAQHKARQALDRLADQQ